MEDGLQLWTNDHVCQETRCGGGGFTIKVQLRFKDCNLTFVYTVHLTCCANRDLLRAEVKRKLRPLIKYQTLIEKIVKIWNKNEGFISCVGPGRAPLFLRAHHSGWIHIFDLALLLFIWALSVITVACDSPEAELCVSSCIFLIFIT